MNWRGLGLDVLLLAAIVALGAAVHRLVPALFWLYVGVVLLLLWWALGAAWQSAQNDNE